MRRCAASPMSCWTCAVSRSFWAVGRFHRITLTDIMRDLAPLNEGRDERHRITYVGLWNHCQRHYGCRSRIKYEEN